MLYMVEMDLPDRSRIEDWHQWYGDHIGKLLTVPGFNGSQRFESLTPSASPFLAIHDVDGPELFDSAGYKSKGGPVNTAPWQDLMTNWYRNLFEGLERMPALSGDERLVVVEGEGELDGLPENRMTWLHVVGLDKTQERRAFVILVPGEETLAFESRDGVRIFKPITEKLT